MRDSFVFYSSFAQAANMLGDKARLKLYDAVVKLGLCCAENVTELEQVCSEIETKLAQNRNAFAQFLLIKPQIIANFTKYINGSKGTKYGVLGGAPVGNKNAVKNNPKTTPNENENDNVNKNDNVLKENTKEKLTFDNVVDWESLFDYWEQNKKGGKYKNAESRNRQLAKLKELTNGDFEYAKQAIVFCIDNKYQGFTDGGKLYYKNAPAAPASRKTAETGQWSYEELMSVF